jgi:hypothetical protein
MDPLPPCPFCHSTDAEPLRLNPRQNPFIWSVYCPACEASGPPAASPAAAEAAWSDRLVYAPQQA